MNIEDRLAIFDLIARYAHTFDAKDTEGWLSLFTEKCDLGTLQGRRVRPANRHGRCDP